MTPKRAAIATLTAVLIVVGALVGAVHAATSDTSENPECTAKPVKKGSHSERRVKALCKRPRPPGPTITKTITAWATLTQTVTATATTTTTAPVAPSSSPTVAPSPTLSPSPTPSASPTASSTPTATPTVSPTASPQGWPDGTNTGVPAGTALTAYTGSCTITATVTITSKTISCPGGLAVKAANVVIVKSKINGPVLVDTDVNRTWSLTLTDSEVDAGAGDWASISNGNVDLLRVDIHGGHNGLECQEHASWCSIRDSYIHDQFRPPSGDVHLGGLLGLGSVMPCRNSLCMEVVHNTVVCDAPVNADGGGCTGDINLLPHFGPLHGALIQGNLLGGNVGSSYCTYGGAGMEHAASHIVYTGNVFQRGANRKCAAYGPVTNFDSAAVGNVWSGNVWDDGTPVAAAH